MRARGSGSGRERVALLAMWGLAVLGCFLGLAFRPPTGAHPGIAEQALDLVRVLTTAALAIVLVLGPGLALRAGDSRRRLELGFVPLPGLAVLAITGSVAWALSKAIPPRAVCVLLLAPVLCWLLASVLRARPGELLKSAERGALMLVAAALGVAVARSLWSLGPPSELFGGTAFRTLEVGDRSDPTISFGLVRLIANGHSPFSALARSYFADYTFSDRGPLAGLASAPVVLLTGGRPPVTGYGGPWSPFDSAGFEAYRVAMMTFAATAFLSVWELTRRLAGGQAARFALLLCATTPFLVHEIWFTWPKLFAASLVLLSVVTLLEGRPLVAGLLLGTGYLVHPLALLSVPALGLLALWPLRGIRASRANVGAAQGGPRVPRPQLRPALLLLAGVATCLIAWRLANWSHYTQSSFLNYLTQAGSVNTLHRDLILALGGHPGPVTLSLWLSGRLLSLANTLVPLRLFVFSAHDFSINAATPSCYALCSVRSPGIVHFFFQYWTGVPFGLGIVFFPLLLQSLWRALRRWPWGITATVIVPFVVFATYWGGADSGLLREGLHTLVLTLLVVVAVEQQHTRFAWLRKASVRALLALRAVEVLLVAMLPTIATGHRLYEPQFRLTDIVAVSAMVILSGCLGMSVWRQRVPLTRAPDGCMSGVPGAPVNR